MKFISSVVGLAAVHAAADETIPERGISQVDLIDFINRKYLFASGPSILSGQVQSSPPILQFQGGVFINPKGERIHFARLAVATNGDVVWAQNTDLADEILTDYLRNLESELGYRIFDKNLERIYQSVVVVEFDQRAVEKLNGSLFVADVNNAAGNPEAPFAIKRLSFGQDASNYTPVLPGVREIVPRDFTIERRANIKMDSNRFFCSAPLVTGRHVAMLESFERRFF